MPSEEFKDRNIEVIDFDDVTSGERVIEFRDPQVRRNDSILAISVPDEGDWGDATISIDPAAGDVPVAFALWAIKVAQTRIG
ncbi:hypothetical protein ACH4U6_07675 [Streptomyces netropsis]|uniref:hypothetical protein n=1 Tax=Streptomyces netropsis TaxID=55404 RepID=UPI0037B8ED16